jgi:hypothetical protein
MRAFLSACLLALAAACSDSHAGKPGPGGAVEEEEAFTPGEDPRSADTTERDVDRAPDPESPGTLPAVPALGDTVRAVRAETVELWVGLFSVLSCEATPADARFAAQLRILHQDCETLGPIEVDWSDPEAVKLTVWLWRSNGPCGSQYVDTYRLLKLAPPGPGTYTFAQSAHPGYEWLTITASDARRDVTSDGACLHDGDCAQGLACLYGYNADLRCSSRCEPTCDNALGCRGARHSVACFSDADCSPGLACIEGRCRWVTELGQKARHACVRHADCAAGLLCVEGEDGALACDVPCNAADMGCPGTHDCRRDALYTSARWVCEWGGE